MPRLVVLWTRPYHLSARDADAWTRREATRLLELDGVERVDLTRLHSPDKHVVEWDWMLELHLREGVDPHACADAAECADWVLDLRLLGMRPAVVVVEDSLTLTRESR